MGVRRKRVPCGESAWRTTAKSQQTCSSEIRKMDENAVRSLAGRTLKEGRVKRGSCGESASAKASE